VNYLRFVQCKEPGIERLREESKEEIIILFRCRLPCICQFTFGKDSVVGTETCYGLNYPRIEANLGEFFLMSIRALGPTQLPVKWVPSLSRN
jgi:hypothetical protein